MMLALVIMACLFAAVVAAAAVRRGVLHAWTAVPLVTLLPMAAWLLFQARAETERSPWEFEVVGQYHRLTDTLHVGTAADADVMLREDPLAGTDVRVSYAGGDDSVHVRVVRSALPVLIGGVPVNAVRLARSAVVVNGGGDSIAVLRPWYCFRCDTRIVRSGGGEREMRIGSGIRLAVGADTVRVFRAAGATWAAADPDGGIVVDGNSIPAMLVARSDTLQLGAPAVARVRLNASAASHRMEVRFDRDGARRWTLPTADGDTLRMLVASTNAEPVPGTLPVLNPAMAAPGAGKQPYGGMLRQHPDGWEWLAHGTSRAFSTSAEERLPGDAATGHIVRLRQFDTNPGAARLAAIAAWLAGAFVLAWSMRLLHPEALALRVFLLGGVYTLAAVRGTLAFRAWLALPHDTTSPVTFLALLLALPLLSALLHTWSSASARGHGGGLLRARSTRIDIAVITIPILLAASIGAMLVLPDWRVDILRAAAGAVVGGLLGLFVLNRLLVAGTTGARGGNPIAAVTLAPDEGYTHREFLHAIVLLGVLALLLLIVTELVKLGTLLALLGWGVILIAVQLATAGPRALIQPRSTRRTLFIAVPAAVAAAAIALVLGRGPVVAAAALAIAGGIAWLLTSRSALRLRPVHLRDLAGPPLTLALLVSLAAVLFPGLVSSVRVLAEYGLALAGLIVVARIFTILWFRHTQQVASRVRSAASHISLPGAAAIGVVLLLLVAAVYAPLAVFDTGLVLLFFAATATVIFAGFWMIGARALGVLLVVAVVATFFLGMFVRRADLMDGTAGLNTARIRYAATYHPEALQRHMLLTEDGRPITVVRTLQQYWGMRHHAAGGTDGHGYFGAEHADWIVPWQVALAENAFGVFVLSEHGWLGGAAVLLCYLSIALALLYGAWRACARLHSSPRALLLVGIAAFVAVPALYIAGANGLLLPLTGQNMPMLGLLSSADVALACWLAAVGLVALPVESESGGEHVRSGGWTRRLRSAIVAIAFVFGAATVTLAALLWRPAHADVADFGMDALVADVEALVEQGAITVSDDTLAIAPGGERNPFLRRGGFIATRLTRANAIARGEAGGAGCLDGDALLRVRTDGSIAVHSSLCSLRAVVEGRRDWQGALVADVAAAEFAITDGSSAVLLDPASDAEAVVGPCAPAGVQRARTVRIGCDEGAARLRFGTSAPVLERAPAALMLNGAEAAAPVMLHDRDHLHVSESVHAWVVQVPRGALSYPRWENGATRRVHETALEPWLAQLDTQLARGMSDPARAALDATVTIEPQLQRALRESLAAACAAADVRRCSALIADPHTGAVHAFTATFTQPHRYLPADANLRNHPAASAIKPITAAAALHAFPSLRTLQVLHDAGEYDVIANMPLQPPVRAGRLYPSAMVPWQGFLGASDNVYAITLGFLAASDRGGDLPVLRGNSAQSRMLLNGTTLRGQPTWSNGGDIVGSPFAAALHDLYGVHVRSADAPAYEHAWWQRAVEAGAVVASGDVQRITPEPVSLAMEAITTPRQFATFLLGGGRNRWNNVALVQAFSRIYTGRAVQLQLLRSIGDATLMDAPAPLEAADVARNAVLDGLRAVVEEPWGTGSGLRGVFAPKVRWRAKTGTLQEREWNGSIFLFAGDGSGVCAAAGIVTVEMNGNARPDGRATAIFREAIAPLLQDGLGWGAQACTR